MSKIINDAVFGTIYIDPYVLPIIDSVEFQRLRWIWQLGSAPFVYPTASHTRFEHCIGTYWLATRLVRHLKDQLRLDNSDEVISDQDVICIQIAALLHDIGHGPFSHVWDHKVLPALQADTGKKLEIEHEAKFSEMWRLMKTNNPEIGLTLQKQGLTEWHDTLIDRLIQGHPGSGDQKLLFHIVSNPYSGMDVDKWDYIARDSYYLGHTNTNFVNTIERLVHFARAVRDSNNHTQWTLAYRDKECLLVLEVFRLRHFLHQTAYQHRKTVAMDTMIVDGFKRCIREGHLKIEDVDSPKWLLTQTDGLFWKMFMEHNIPEFKNILQRKLHEIVVEVITYDIVLNPKEAILIILTEGQKIDQNQIEHIRFSFSKFQLGNLEDNPILKIPFYTKFNNKSYFHFNNDNLPNKLNLNFNECRLIVSVTEKFQKSKIPIIKEIIQNWTTQNNWKVLGNV